MVDTPEHSSPNDDNPFVELPEISPSLDPILINLAHGDEAYLSRLAAVALARNKLERDVAAQKSAEVVLADRENLTEMEHELSDYRAKHGYLSPESPDDVG